MEELVELPLGFDPTFTRLADRRAEAIDAFGRYLVSRFDEREPRREIRKRLPGTEVLIEVNIRKLGYPVTCPSENVFNGSRFPWETYYNRRLYW